MILFSPSSPAGQCVRSALALALVLIHQTAQHKRTGAPSYHIYIHRSFAEYMWAWLEDAAAEYGLQIKTFQTRKNT